MTRPTFGACDVCGEYGPLALTACNASDALCGPCAAQHDLDCAALAWLVAEGLTLTQVSALTA